MRSRRRSFCRPDSVGAIPYLYSEAEITALMQAARGIRSPLKAATYETLIGLLSVTGMRIGEVIGLDRGDVVLSERSLTIRHGKNDVLAKLRSIDDDDSARGLRGGPRRALHRPPRPELLCHQHRPAVAQGDGLARVRRLRRTCDWTARPSA